MVFRTKIRNEFNWKSFKFTTLSGRIRQCCQDNWIVWLFDYVTLSRSILLQSLKQHQFLEWYGKSKVFQLIITINVPRIIWPRIWIYYFFQSVSFSSCSTWVLFSCNMSSTVMRGTLTPTKHDVNINDLRCSKFFIWTFRII